MKASTKSKIEAYYKLLKENYDGSVFPQMSAYLDALQDFHLISREENTEAFCKLVEEE